MASHSVPLRYNSRSSITPNPFSIKGIEIRKNSKTSAMGLWKNFKEGFSEREYQRDKAAGVDHMYEYRHSASYQQDQQNEEKRLIKHNDERRRRHDKRIYAHGYDDGRYHEREVRAAYDGGWYDRGMRDHYAQEERRYQQQLAQQRANEQQMDGYGDGGYGHSRRKHRSGHHHGHHHSHRSGEHRAASPANHGRRIAWKDENGRDWHG